MAESTNTPRYQTNTFVGGMNTDTDDSLLQSNQYRFAKNVRLTTTTQSSTGSLHNIDGCFKSVNWLNYTIQGNIIKTDCIRNIGIVITKDITSWHIYTFYYTPDTVDPVITNSIKHILSITGALSDNISTVTRYEDSDNIKLYIADGLLPIRIINIKTAIDYYDVNTLPLYTTERSVSVYKSMVLTKPTITNYGSGMLKSGVIQFGYQLFDKNGVETEISDLTELIPLIKYSSSNDTKTTGIAKDYSSGVSITINISNVSTLFEYIKIVAVYYDENGQLPKIVVLNSAKIPSTHNYLYNISSLDNAISTYTVEEFNSITGSHIIPKVLESKNNYLFASNIQYQDTTFDIDSGYDSRSFAFDSTGKCVFKDGTSLTNWTLPSSYDNTKDCDNISNDLSLYKVNDITQKFCKDTNGSKYFGGNGVNIDYKFIVGNLVEDSFTSNHWVTQSSHTSASTTVNWVQYHTIKQDGTIGESATSNLSNSTIGTTNYSNPLICQDFKSLQRNEIYRYGIVFYDVNGNRSVTKWIADIRTPSQYEIGFNIFNVDTVTGASFNSNSVNKGLITHPLGISFRVKSLPTGAVAYQIVRCKRTVDDRATITQCLLSTAMTRPNNSYCGGTDNYLSPSSILTFNNLRENPGLDNGSYGFTTNTILGSMARTIYSKYNYYNIYSPEYSFLPETYKSYLSDPSLYILPINFVDTLSTNTVTKTVDNISYVNAFDYNTTDGQVDSRVDDPTLIAPNNSVGISTYDKAQENGYFIYLSGVRNGFNYAKLYTQTLSLNKFLSNPNTPAVVSIGSSTLRSDLNIVNYALEASWNDYTKRTDFVSPINSNEFNNWVRSGYGTGVNQYNEYDEFTYQGPGGRSIVAYIPFDIVALYTSTNLTSAVGKTGTFVCNIRRNITPYGGCTVAQRSVSVYYPVGGINSTLSTFIPLFNGDTFICNYDIVKVHRWHSQVTNKTQYGGIVVYSVPVETSINLSLNQGPKIVDETVKDVQLTATNFNNEYSQDIPLYTYNTVYSQLSNVRINTSENPLDEYNKHVDVRTYFSNTKSNDELIDSWSKFQPLNYLDIDTRYGPITNLRTFNNDLLYWQTTAVGKFSVSERSVITDQSNQGLILGTGGVLARYDYLATTNGMRENDMNDTQSDNVLYWFDYDKNELCVYSNGDTVSISKKLNVQNYLNKIKSSKGYKQIISSLYDKEYNEALFSLSTNNESLVYSERVNAFVGIYQLPFVYGMPFSNGSVLVNDNNLYKLNSKGSLTGTYNNNLLPYVQLLVNTAYNYVKVFDNQEIANTLDLSKVLITYSTDKILCESSISNIDDNCISQREYSYRLSIPRYSTSEIGDRYRGRTLTVTLEYTLIGELELSYITTTFRPSLS